MSWCRPGQPLGPAQIHESNSYALAAQAAESGAEVRRLGVARDTLPDLLALVREATAWADVVILSGGVSVGSHDHVKAAFADVGSLDLWRVAIKPGRPFAFANATVDGRAVRLFGLPGNPVSVFVTFELFVRPVLRLLAGHPRAFDRPTRVVRLAEPVRGSTRTPEHHAGRAGARSGPSRWAGRTLVRRPGLLHARVAGGSERDDLRPAGRRSRRSAAEVVAWEMRPRDG